MNEHDQDFPDPDLVAALRAHQEPVPEVARERVAQRLATSVGTLVLQRPAAPRSALRPWAPLAAHPLVFAAGVALGGGMGAGLVAWSHTPRIEIRYVERPAAQRPVPPASSAPASVASAPPPVAQQEPALRVATSAAPTASLQPNAAGQLADQQALLDVAREALSRSDFAAALAALDTHFKRYPKSVLGEERDALQIKALAGSGQLADAQARAARFKARFPQSLLLPSLIDSVGAIP